MKIAITGKPRSGKTTLIKRLVPLFEDLDLRPWGFYTQEVREGGKRTGFDIVLLPSKQVLPLARIGKKPPRVGKYSVFVENLERALREETGDLLILDEVGKMELLSPKFREFLSKVLGSISHAVLTYGLGIDGEVRKEIERKFKVFHLEPSLREEIFRKISQEINREFGDKEN